MVFRESQSSGELFVLMMLSDYQHAEHVAGFLVDSGRLLSPMRRRTFLRMPFRAFQRWPGTLQGTQESIPEIYT